MSSSHSPPIAPALPATPADPRDPTFAASFLGYLEAAGHLDRSAAERAARAARQTRHPLHIVLTELGILSSADLLQAAAGYFKMSIVPPNQWPSVAVDVAGIHSGFFRQNRLLPIGWNDQSVVLATADPFERDAIDAVAYLLERPVEVVLCRTSDLDEAIERCYPDEASAIDTATAAGGTNSVVDEDDVQRLMDSASEAPVIRFVTRIITNAVQSGASDVHIEPMIDALRVRFRIDGVMTEIERQPLGLQSGVASRIKILARLNIAERRLPQDGRAKFVVAGREIDLRISTAPVLYGESVVVRVLDKSTVRLDLSALGFDATLSQRLLGHLAQPNGIIIVTGPTGSGKTTTLYAALKSINNPTRKIFTIEDPIEYELQGVNQVQIKPDIGLDFANALRSLLRQDPDVMLVGEMRDAETVRIAIQASLTGHLVLSTLHTNSAAGSITRLLDMGAEDYLLASTLSAVLAQRLVRTLCAACSRLVDTDSPEVAAVVTAWHSAGHDDAQLHLRQPVGCTQCSSTGFRGRTTILELLTVDDSIREQIRRGTTDRAIERVARAAGMSTLFESGLQKVAMGVTTLEEVLSVTRS